jgi:hypothetical protein
MMPAKRLMLALVLFGIVFAVPTGLSVVINGGGNYTGNISVTLALNATGAENCSLSNDGSSYGTPFPYTTSKVWDLASGDGLKTVYFRCISSNETNWSAAVTDTITLDTAAPQASSKSPIGTVVNRRPTISASLDDSGSGVKESSIVLKLDNATITHNYSSGTVSYVPAGNLTYSSHTVELMAEDEIGNKLNTSWSFIVSSQGVGFGNYGPLGFIGVARPEISVILVDSGSGINSSTLMMKLQGSDVSGDAEYSATAKNYSYTPPTLSKGNYTVEVIVYDLAGKRSNKSWSFFVDTADPYVGMFEPAAGSVVSSVSLISAKVEDDDSGIDTSELFMELNGVDVTASFSYDEDDGVLTFRPTVILTAGEYTVEIWAADKAGNERNVEWSFTVASSAPSYSSLAPSDGSTISDTTPAISATISDTGTSGIDTGTIRLFVDGDEVTSDATYNAANGKLTYTPDTGLEDGEHDVEVRASNNNGDSSEKEWSFTIDSTMPAAPSSFTYNQTESGTYLYWTASTSPDVSDYLVYGSDSSFTTVSSNRLLDTLDSDELEYFDEGETGWRYYALVVKDNTGNQAPPVYVGTCSVYSDGAWDDYECCWDSDCEEGYYCESHTCKATEEVVTEADAEHAINGAQSLIDDARDAGKNVTEAEDYLEDAQNAFNAGNYEQASSFAALARSAALDAPLLEGEEAGEGEEKPLPCCPSAFILLAALVFALRK